MEPKKSLQELTLLNRFLFDETIERPGNLQTMLEIILGEDIVLQCFPQPEKEQQRSPNRRSVRLDVWAQDVTGTVYDAEVQRRNDTVILSQRSAKRCRGFNWRTVPPASSSTPTARMMRISLRN